MMKDYYIDIKIYDSLLRDEIPFEVPHKYLHETISKETIWPAGTYSMLVSSEDNEFIEGISDWAIHQRGVKLLGIMPADMLI